MGCKTMGKGQGGFGVVGGLAGVAIVAVLASWVMAKTDEATLLSAPQLSAPHLAETAEICKMIKMDDTRDACLMEVANVSIYSGQASIRQATTFCEGITDVGKKDACLGLFVKASVVKTVDDAGSSDQGKPAPKVVLFPAEARPTLKELSAEVSLPMATDHSGLCKTLRGVASGEKLPTYHDRAAARPTMAEQSKVGSVGNQAVRDLEHCK